jgi:hypothetical protein
MQHIAYFTQEIDRTRKFSAGLSLVDRQRIHRRTAPRLHVLAFRLIHRAEPG